MTAAAPVRKMQTVPQISVHFRKTFCMHIIQKGIVLFGYNVY